MGRNRCGEMVKKKKSWLEIELEEAKWTLEQKEKDYYRLKVDFDNFRLEAEKRERKIIERFVQAAKSLNRAFSAFVMAENLIKEARSDLGTNDYMIDSLKQK